MDRDRVVINETDERTDGESKIQTEEEPEGSNSDNDETEQGRT